MSETTIPQDSFSASPQQEQLWLAEPYGPSGRVQAVVALVGRLDAAALESALRATVARHEVLRTTFVRRPGIRVPLQMIHEQLNPQWRTRDLSVLEPAEAVRMLENARRAELSEPFDFVNGPLVRGLLVSRGDDWHRLVLTLSDLCADPSSIAPLLRELVHQHSGVGQLVGEPLQYADYAEWQREVTVSENEEARDARVFWSSFQDAVSPSLPFAKSTASAFVPDEVTVELPRAPRAIDPALVQAAWHAVLARASGEDSVTVGVVGPLRRHADLHGAIGAFGQALPIHADVAGETRFADLVSRLQRATEEAATHEDYAPVAIGRGLAIGFLAPEAFHAQAGSLDVSLERIATSGPQFRLWLTYQRCRGRVCLSLSYDPRWLGREAVTRLGRRLELMIAGVVSDASVALAELDLLDEPERRQLLIDFNQTAAPIPSQSIHELIAAWAAVSPGRTAVVDERGSITYAELEARSNQLGHRLQRAGVGAEVPVGLCADRSIGMIIGLLGILKAGGAYLPLHSEHPPARLAAQLETAGARAIVTQDALLDRLPGIDGEIVCLDRAADREALDAEPTTAPETATKPDSLAYAIYTSGSTGAPKGVGVTHANLANYAADIIRRLGADQEPLAFGLATSISTDLGNTSVFGALCSGGTLVLLSPGTTADGAALARQLEATPVDVLKITPSHITALLVGRDPNVLPRRWLILGGERAPWDLIARIRELSGVKVLNHYGPTETTVGSCTMEVGDGPGPFEPASVPIGRPIANTWCYVLDDRLGPAPLGVAGRLFIGGAGVARGYVGQPELTRERFVPDPFAVAGLSRDDPEARMYDTGDLARWLPDQTLEFLGRCDEQVKIRGYRVEPAEVESALRSQEQVNEAVVVAQPGASGELRLVAYCTTDGAASQGDLSDHLKRWLPEYMLPSTIAILGELPRTPSGKIDRLALPDPATLSGPSHTHVPPRTDVERAVAALWSRLLGADQVGITDDFFELGGHSLLATQTIAQLRSEFAVDLPLHAMFLSPTVEWLAAEIVRLTEEYEQAEAQQLSDELAQRSDAASERRTAGGPTPPDAS